MGGVAYLLGTNSEIMKNYGGGAGGDPVTCRRIGPQLNDGYRQPLQIELIGVMKRKEEKTITHKSTTA